MTKRYKLRIYRLQRLGWDSKTLYAHLSGQTSKELHDSAKKVLEAFHPGWSLVWIREATVTGQRKTNEFWPEGLSEELSRRGLIPIGLEQHATAYIFRFSSEHRPLPFYTGGFGILQWVMNQ